MQELLADEECSAEVLAHYAPQAARDEALAERVAFHARAPAAALAVLASTGSPAVVDLVMTNEERLLANPTLLERLMINPTLRPNQRARILEFLDRATKAQKKSRAAGDSDEAAESGAEATLDDAADLLEVDVGELFSSSEITDGEEFEACEDEVIRDAYRRIVSLNTAQKAILAMKGGREERMILIRDTNKVVSLGVMKNPRLGDTEVEGFAAMRNVSDDILRRIGQSREWTKNYRVVLSLVNNPRTPQSVAMNHVGRLTNRDLQNLLRNREVPELIRRSARRVHDMRTKPKGVVFRRK